MDRPRPGGRHQRTGDLVPVRKVSAGAIGGALATVALWLLGLGVEVPAIVAAAVTALITAGVAYVVPSERLS